jgi:hypothetical protein
MLAYPSVYGQSIWDVCLNTYGSFDYLRKLLDDNGIENIDQVPASGQVFNWDETISTNANQISSNSNVILATGMLKNSSVLSVVEENEAIGIVFPVYNQPSNPVIGKKYEVTLETQYIAGGGETSIILTELIGSSIVQLNREIQPQRAGTFTLNINTGQITFSSDPLVETETIYIIYTKIVSE